MSELKIAQVNWTSDIIEVIPNGSFTLIKIETDSENRKGCNRLRLLRWTDAYSWNPLYIFSGTVLSIGLGVRVFRDKQFC